MYFQFLIEDKSGMILVENLMTKLGVDNVSNSYSCKYFHGIGGFSKKNTVKEIKTGKLLNDLIIYLKGFDKSLQNMKNDAVIFVVLDNDTRDTIEFQKELEEVAKKCDITVDHVFCLAVEEMEAWLLGDHAAICEAYPMAKLNVLQRYEQDSICGTWETLADVVYDGGVKKLRKDCPTYYELGRQKCEWAEKIGKLMDVGNNKSPSFQCFVNEVRKRLSA